MLLTFATADEVFADYATVLVWGAVVIVVTIITLGAANKGSPSEVKTSTAIKIGCFAYLLLIVASYRANYGSFTGAEVTPEEVRLSYAGSLYDTTTFKSSQLKDVLVGYPGKGVPHSCYLKFVTSSGDSYRSAQTAGTACKEQREQILALLK